MGNSPHKMAIPGFEMKLFRACEVPYPMKIRHVLLLFLAAFVPPARAYDPCVTGAEPTSIDLDLAVSDSRRIPVRIFLPADKNPAPVILFSHGLGGSRGGSNFLGRHWSSRGYVTVFLQHPGSDSSVWQGKKPMEILPAMKSAANGTQYLARISDVKGGLDALAKKNSDPKDPLHNRLNLECVGMSGHSFGALTTQAVSGQQAGLAILSREVQDPRIKAAIPMSPSPATGVDPGRSFGKVSIPWLLMTGTKDSSPSGISPTTPADRQKVYPALPPGDKYELVLMDAEHSAFTERKLPGEGKTRNPNHHKVILSTSTAFWDAYLKKDPAALAWLKNDARSVMEDGDRWQLK